ncbi:hypothetical protein DNI07_16840 [Salmonella enterica subsp. enterica]|nr:hypothetical protein [Salmonella enterica subsp. enterica]
MLGLRNNIWLRAWKTLFITTEHLYGVTPVTFTVLRSPELARIRRGHATALKPTHKAGRRGGESIARQRWCGIIKIIV